MSFSLNSQPNTLAVLKSYSFSIEKQVFNLKIQIPSDVTNLIQNFYGYYNYRLRPQTNHPQSPLKFAYKNCIIHNPYHLYRGASKIIYQDFKNQIFISGQSWNKWTTNTQLQSIATIKDIKDKNNKIINLKDIDYISVISEGLNSSFTLMVSNKGKVYGLGYFLSMSFILMLSNIQLTLSEYSIKKICCGIEHILILTTNGCVFAMGSNTLGQLGVDIKNKMGVNNYFIKSPEKIKMDENVFKIIDICCGTYHNLLLSKSNKLWVFGKNQSGEIGLGKGSQFKVEIPMINPLLSHLEFKRIECGSRHSLCITMDGKCYLFGRNGYGQCGKGVIKSSVHRCKTPYLFQSFMVGFIDFKDVLIESASLGQLHTVLLTKNNKCITFGCNSFGKCSRLKLWSRCIRDPYWLNKSEIGISDDEVIIRVLALKHSTLIITAHS